MMAAAGLRIGIACYPTLGGSGIVATELGIALARRGHQVHFLAYSELPRLGDEPGVHVHRINVSAYPLFKYPPYDLALASKMLDLMDHCGLDVLHAHYAIPHAISSYLARQMSGRKSTAIVTTLHGTDITVVGSDAAYRAVTRFALENSDRLLAVSRFLADETTCLFDISKKIEVAYNFVDSSRFSPGPKSGSGPFVLVHVSTFRPVKRPLDVISAFHRIRSTAPARLRLVGDGPELPGCLDLARSLGLSSEIDVVGAVTNVEVELASAHVLLQPSGSEAFGLAALEAMACEVPVVAYRVGGLPEVVVDGESGFLVPFRDVDALARRTVALLESAEMRKAFGRNGRRRAITEFCVDRSVETHERLYREALLEIR